MKTRYILNRSLNSILVYIFKKSRIVINLSIDLGEPFIRVKDNKLDLNTGLRESSKEETELLLLVIKG